MNEQPKKVIGHIEERNGTHIFVITEDNRNIPETKKHITNKNKIDIKKYTPDFIKNSKQYKD